MKEQDEIEQLFSSSFDGFEKTPPLDVKAAIDASLFAAGSVNTEAPTKRRRGIIWWFTLAALIGLSGLGGGLFLSSRNSGNESNDSSGAISQVSKQNQDLENRVSKHNVKQNQVVDSINSTQTSSSNSSSNSSKEDIIMSSKTTIKKSNPIVKNVKGKSKSSLNGNLLRNGTGIKEKVFEPQNYISVEASTNNKLNEDESLTAVNANNDDEEQLAKNEISNNSNQKAVEAQSTKLDSSSVNTNETMNNTASNSKLPIPTDIKSQNNSPFSISIYGGMTYGLSSLTQPSTSNFEMKEALGFSSSVEVNYALNSRFGFGVGVDLNSRMDNFYTYEATTDSAYVGLMPQYVYDPQNTDSIIDTLYVEEYNLTTTTIEQSQFIRHTSFALPLTFNWNLYTKGKWNYGLATVVRLSYVNNKLVSNEQNLEIPEFKKFSARLSLRPQVMYSFDEFALGAYLNVGYDLIPTLQWTDIQRNRIDLGGGLFLRIQL